MTKPYKNLDELIEESSKKAKAEKIARSQAQRLEDEHNWRCGYDNLHEGGLGDY